MHAVVMDVLGGPDVLKYRQVPDPIPGPGQVLVAVEYASVTFVETQVRAGRGPAAGSPRALPRIPGNGVGGRVVGVGPDVDGALAGTVVVTTTGGEGGYAELAVARADDVLVVPDGVGLRDAVALLADGRTAVGLHRGAKVRAGEWVLVGAAGGGVGSLLVQLAAAAGAQVVGAAGGDGKRALVESLGARAYVDYTHAGWGSEVLDATGGVGVDVVFDGVGGAVGATALTTLRPGGRISVHGMASGSATTVDEADAAARSIEVIVMQGLPPAAELRALSAAALDLAADGRLRPTVGQLVPLAEAAAAHRAIENRTTVGKTLLVV